MKAKNNRRKAVKTKGVISHRLTAKNRVIRIKSRDFSAIEDDVKSFEIIKKLANNAGRYALAEAKAMGIGTVYALDNRLIKVFSEGQTETVKPKLERESYYIKYKPSTVLHVVQK